MAWTLHVTVAAFTYCLTSLLLRTCLADSLDSSGACDANVQNIETAQDLGESLMQIRQSTPQTNRPHAKRLHNKEEARKGSLVQKSQKGGDAGIFDSFFATSDNTTSEEVAAQDSEQAQEGNPVSAKGDGEEAGGDKSATSPYSAIATHKSASDKAEREKLIAAEIVKEKMLRAKKAKEKLEVKTKAAEEAAEKVASAKAAAQQVAQKKATKAAAALEQAVKERKGAESMLGKKLENEKLAIAEASKAKQLVEHMSTASDAANNTNTDEDGGEASFIMGEKGETTCPTGYQMVKSLESCKAAASNLDGKWDSWDGWQGPSCAYIDSAGAHDSGKYDGDVYYNAGARDEWQEKTYARPVCTAVEAGDSQESE